MSSHEGKDEATASETSQNHHSQPTWAALTLFISHHIRGSLFFSLLLLLLDLSSDLLAN